MKASSIPIYFIILIYYISQYIILSQYIIFPIYYMSNILYFQNITFPNILYFFLHYCSKILHKKSQVISSKNEGITVIFPNFDLNLNQENCHHAFISAQNNLKFFVQNFSTIMQKNYKIAMVKFCLQIAQNCDQSCANFQFSPRVVQFKFSPPGGLWRHLQIILSCLEL